MIKCKVRTEKSVLMRACGEVLSVHSPVAFMAVATVWTRNCQKKQSEKCAKNYEWNPDSGELDNN